MRICRIDCRNFVIKLFFDERGLIALVLLSVNKNLEKVEGHNVRNTVIITR